ncbi:uncharacterized protein LOC116339812 isoform X2 [Contarinia nasturtii]|uniref:uncharacterized protein LOC116339812 isoform X2 n=1 Tax=Contarinia nasturtii TaxID=265458 RepID=UPI0012D3A3DC|nr:uncharacterized protein LOC116339812 isoform X2 [Contarinia nasturtii]
MAKTHEMLLDVKLDFKDVRNDNFLKNWVNWMKCLVKIEAIECFPCYLKIEFYHEDDVSREYPISVIRINIPGVRVGSAASRTKSYTYGVFWKSNRKRCRLFLAFQDKQSCSTHMKWLKQSIDSLENYRKGMCENPRINRSLINVVKFNDEDDSQFDISKGSLNDTLTDRDMNDILGPLPDIPVNHDMSSRLSVRRSSGCSGIYEEILDTSDVSVNEHESRGSVVSGIYVDMSSAPLKINESAEQPPPLPPRRQINHVYTSINSQTVAIAAASKSRKSAWNLKNVFGRTKETSKNGKINDVPKSQTAASISKLCSNNFESNLLVNCTNSFSTPDLTNINVEPKKTTSATKCECEETDLDVMDIERSNSLNCSSSQFTCRPPPLNISDNILWSHNLSLTLTSTVDSSAINLVGANVNNRDSFLGRDISGYCRMAPILNDTDRFKMIRTSTTHFEEDQLNKLNQGFDNASVYCAMAPILPKIDQSSILKIDADSTSTSNILKHITFERQFDFDEERPISILDSSMKSVDNSNNASSSLSDITSSSGVSSYDGNAAMLNTRCFTPETTNNTTVDSHEHDDAISLTYTESPPQSAKLSQHINENPFNFQSSKFDEKTPSYFPNEKFSPVHDTIKYIVYNSIKNVKQTPKTNRRIPSEPVAIPLNNKESNHEAGNNSGHFKNVKKQTCKGVLKTPTSGKIQKYKQRRGSITENNGTHIEHHPTAIAYKNENWYCDMKSYQTMAESYKYDTLPSSFDSKNVLSHLDPNTKYEPNRHANFEKNSKATKLKSSPRRIYNKCANLAIRMKTPPSTPTEMTPDDQLNSSIDTVMRSNKSYHMSNDGSSNGLIRSWARFRKIDFSPLKTKINSIWQRPNTETFN